MLKLLILLPALGLLAGWYERRLMADIKAAGWDFRISFHAWADNKPAAVWFVQAWIPARGSALRHQFSTHANSVLEGLVFIHGKIKEIEP